MLSHTFAVPVGSALSFTLTNTTPPPHTHTLSLSLTPSHALTRSHTLSRTHAPPTCRHPLLLQVGEALLAEYVFIHLDPARPADKLNLLVAMLHKLYALVCGACAEDNPDALTHHEILLPGGWEEG